MNSYFIWFYQIFYQTEDEYVLSGEESEDETRDNVLVIHGSCGVGKTSTVHACANQLGFQVSLQKII